MAALTLLCVMMTLFWGQNAGLSDNGDFARVMKVNRIYPKGDGQSSFLFQQYYTMDVEGDSFPAQLGSLFSTTMEDELYSSPQFAFIKASKALNLAYNHLCGNSSGDYNLAFLALLYALVLAAAAALTVRHLPGGTLPRRIFAGLLFLFFFCDAGYLLYFNSFYGEALQFVALWLAVGLWLRLYENARRPVTWALLFAALYFFGGSKLANIPLAALFALCSLLLLLRGGGLATRVTACVLCAALLAGEVALYRSIPAWMDDDTNYQAVFFGVLKNSETPEQDLQQLGIDPKYAPLAGTHAYQQSYPVDIYSDTFRQDFFETISKVDVAKFYLTHPLRLAGKMDTALMCSAYIRPPYLGNLSSKRMVQIGRGSAWSWLRVRTGVLYHAPVMTAALLALSLFALLRVIWCLRKKRPREKLAADAMLLALCAALWASWALPIVGNGEADLSKHMFLFIHLVDLTLAAGLVFAAPKLLRLARWALANWKKAAAGAGALTVVVLILVLVHVQVGPKEVEFGHFEGKPLIWQVVREDESTMTLVCRDVVAHRVFDEKGSNLWSESSLRGWLGSTFLAQFTQEELKKLVAVPQRELLSLPYASLSEGGEHPLFWHFDPRKAADLVEDSYYKTTLDVVYLPTPELFRDVPAKCGADWWMLAPYGNNGKMERVVKKDGFILLRDAEEVAGVRPALTVRK